ncbi:hypothetical protein C8R43DRAFT_966133 [Mycena crocata]|nr:hypothetical protein C8R43DRAFT_966133 [Mycena crocata]
MTPTSRSNPSNRNPRCTTTRTWTAPKQSNLDDDTYTYPPPSPTGRPPSTVPWGPPSSASTAAAAAALERGGLAVARPAWRNSSFANNPSMNDSAFCPPTPLFRRLGIGFAAPLPPRVPLATPPRKSLATPANGELSSIPTEAARTLAQILGVPVGNASTAHASSAVSAAAITPTAPSTVVTPTIITPMPASSVVAPEIITPAPVSSVVIAPTDISLSSDGAASVKSWSFPESRPPVKSAPEKKKAAAANLASKTKAAQVATSKQKKLTQAAAATDTADVGRCSGEGGERGRWWRPRMRGMSAERWRTPPTSATTSTPPPAPPPYRPSRPLSSTTRAPTTVGTLRRWWTSDGQLWRRGRRAAAEKAKKREVEVKHCVPAPPRQRVRKNNVPKYSGRRFWASEDIGKFKPRLRHLLLFIISFEPKMNVRRDDRAEGSVKGDESEERPFQEPSRSHLHRLQRYWQASSTTPAPSEAWGFLDGAEAWTLLNQRSLLFLVASPRRYRCRARRLSGIFCGLSEIFDKFPTNFSFSHIWRDGDCLIDRLSSISQLSNNDWFESKLTW